MTGNTTQDERSQVNFLKVISVLPLGITCAQLLTSAPCAAEAISYGVIQEGATRKDVIKLLGPPKEQHEEEARRRIIWEYKNFKVVFQDGKVIQQFSPHKALQVPSATVPPRKTGSTTAVGPRNDSLFNEILDALPGEKGTGDGNVSSNLSGNMPPQGFPGRSE